MSLVNQSQRLIAILIQFFICKAKIEDLVTIRNLLFIFTMDPLLILIQLEVLIQFQNYVS